MSCCSICCDAAFSFAVQHFRGGKVPQPGNAWVPHSRVAAAPGGKGFAQSVEGGAGVYRDFFETGHQSREHVLTHM
jgi:hypothetical protein